MQFYYGEQNIFRALDEAEFWMHQQAEHTSVIQAVTPDLEPQYHLKLDSFGSEFHKLHGELVKYTQTVTRSKGMVSREFRKNMLTLIQKCIKITGEFIDLLEIMLHDSSAVRNNQTSQAVIHHIIRESQYFIGIDQLILS